MDEPEQPEGQPDQEPLSLDEQLDALVHRLEEVEPSLVPADLRKSPPEEPPPIEAPAPQPEPVAEPVTAEASSDTPQEQSSPQDTGLEAQLDTLLKEMAQNASPPPQQEPQATPVQTVKAVETDVDLESVEQLASDLIDQQINSATEPDEPPAQAPPPEARAEETPPPQPAQAQPDEPQAKPTESFTLNEDKLSSQIESLLKDAKLTGSADAPTEELAEAEPPATPAATEQAQPAAQTPATADPAPAQEDGPVSIEQIDTMLADSAEQAIEQASAEPQPVDEAPLVPSTDEVLAQQAKAQEEAQAQKQSADQSAQPAAVEVPPAGATSEDVARELNEDAAEQTAEQSGLEPKTKPEPAEIGVAEEGTVATRPGNLRKAERAMFRLCKAVNRPLKRLSPEMRDAVGYVGVLSVGVGFFALIFGVLF